jgi:hypothetical protein
MTKTIEIQAPVALPGTAVIVRNYRCKPAAWERGEVEQAIFRPTYQATRCDGTAYSVPWRWSYTVFIDCSVKQNKYGRRLGGGYRIEVGDDDIRVADGEA